MLNLNLLQRALISLSGYDRKTVEQSTSTELNKICMAGTLVLIPGFIALFSYGYAIGLIFKSLWAGVIGGFVSSIVLILIDRALMSWTRKRSFNLGLASRLAFAVVIGVMMAEPVVIKIFDDSIKEQQYSELQELKKQSISDLMVKENEIRNKLTFEQRKLEDLRLAYTQEMDGTGGSGEKNQGPIYKKKYEDYINAKAEFESNKDKYNKELYSIQNEKEFEQEQVKNYNATGLIGQMRALNQLAEKENIVFVGMWLCRIMLMLLELLPFFLKLTPTGDKELYYKIQDAADEENEAVLNALTAERIKIKETEARLKYQQQMYELKLKELEKITEFKHKEALLLMDEAYKLAEKKISKSTVVAETVMNENLKNKILERFDAIFNNYLVSLDQMITTSNKNNNI